MFLILFILSHSLPKIKYLFSFFYGFSLIWDRNVWPTKTVRDFFVAKPSDLHKKSKAEAFPYMFKKLLYCFVYGSYSE